MTLSNLIAAIILTLLCVILADYLLKPDFDDDTPIALDLLDTTRPVSEDFEKYLDTLPIEKRQLLIDYLRRVDSENLRQNERDYNVQAVTPAEVFKANQSNPALLMP